MILLLLLVSTVFIYYRTLEYGLVSDDLPAFKRTLEVKKSLEKLTGWKKTVAYWHQDLRGINTLRRGHAITLAFHTVNVGLMYLAFGFWPAALFMVHPFGLMCSVWVSGRAYSMVTTFALLCWLLPMIYPVTYVVAVYWSISALFIPLVQSLWTITITPFLIALALVAGAGWWRFNPEGKWGKALFNADVKGSKAANESNLELRALKPRKIIMFLKTYGYYFRNGLFPYRMGLFHKFIYTYGLNEKENKKAYSLDGAFWAGVLSIVVTGVGIYYGLRTGYRPFTVGLVWFLVHVSMWCNVVTFNQQIAERYVYLPLVGLMVALVGLCQMVPYPVLPLIFTAYLVRLHWFMPSLANEYWNVEYNIMEQKDLYYIWLSRGVHRWSEGNFHDALWNLIKSFELRPEDFKTNLNIFYVALALNNLELAKKHIELASKCVVQGKEEEINGFVTYGKNMLQQIELDIAKGGSAKVDIKAMQLLL